MKVGTRGSNLAMIQTKNIIHTLSKKTEEDIGIKIIKTTGDKIKDSQLYRMDVKGIFTKELDKAVLEEEVDFAVHSLKDLPSELNPELDIMAVPLRESPHEVLVSHCSWNNLPESSIMGTSSLRREAFCKYHHKNFDIKPIRGNIDTRIKKVFSGDYDATLMAEAGLKRLGLTEHIRERFPLDYITPAAGQGALAVIARHDNINKKLLKSLNHYTSYQEVKSEKKVLEELGIGCQWPLGVCARAQDNQIELYTILLSKNGEILSKIKQKAPISQAEDLGLEVARLIQEDYS